ncbi:MAG: alpha/beta fold hydrolase [Acidaminococcaceae bacterium]|nr:alpha/beta fold hydrolase [Acidaminococcaceae bacterium]
MKKTAILLTMLAMFSTGAFAAENLTLETQGHFAAGGTTIQREGTYDNKKFNGWASPVEQGQSYRGDHAVVGYQIPARAKNAPLLFIHGYGGSGLCWEMTPDGREGFSTLMLRRHYPAFVMDLPGRGRARKTTAASTLTPKADEMLWFDIWRLGEYPNYHADVQFPKDPETLDQFFREMTPDLSAHNMSTDLAAISAAVDKASAISAKAGAAKETPGVVLVTHSAGGFPGWLSAMGNQKVKAVASYEPGGYVFPEKEVPDPMPSLTGTVSGVPVPMEQFKRLTEIPIVMYFGDYIPEEVSDKLGNENWRVRLQMARKFAETVNRHGGNATVVELPKLGIKGNTHFLMSDLNNGQLASLLDQWLQEQKLDR